jgi:predicted nucleotidyltransferase component of viral defense system
MFNIKRHKTLLVQILKDIYSDIEIASLLGFKGGTALMLFHDLPRFSVDLDFNLLSDEKHELVYQRIENILLKYGTIHDKAQKHYGLLLVLDYGENERKLKVEVSNRLFGETYSIKSYLGIPVKIMDISDMLSNKLVAITDRDILTMRDIFDCHFLMNKRIEIKANIIKTRTGLSVSEYLDKCKQVVSRIPTNRVLNGLGELIDDEQKNNIKNNLINDFIFLCDLYK